MSTTLVRRLELTPTTGLSYDRTVPRQLVHRTAVSEVFLTDIQRREGGRVSVAAHLPSSHAFFHDRVDQQIDSLLLLEIARQATIASAHELGVPLDSVLISSEFALLLKDREFRDIAPAAKAVIVENHFEWTNHRSGVPRAGRCDQHIFVDGALVAKHWSAGRVMTRQQLHTLRSEYRGDLPPLSHQMTAVEPHDPVAPALVGRTSARNVVLSRLDRTPARTAARVTPTLTNRALFDHSYDHVTMQILTEAARQLHTLLCPRPADSVSYPSVTGKFHSFAELDSELTIICSDAGRYVVEQDGREVAEFVLTDTEAPGEGDGA